MALGRGRAGKHVFPPLWARTGEIAEENVNTHHFLHKGISTHGTQLYPAGRRKVRATIAGGADDVATPPLLIFVLGALSLCGPREEVVLFGSGTAQVVDEGGVLDWVAADLIHDDSPVCIEGATDALAPTWTTSTSGLIGPPSLLTCLSPKGYRARVWC
jgi:hypothetical protein